MSIYSNSVNRPVTTILIFVGLMVIGLYSLTQLPVDLYPEIELPFVGVVTTYPGTSASDIETNITRPLEDVLNSVVNLKEMTSTSSDGLSVIFMNFEYGTNLDEATNDITCRPKSPAESSRSEFRKGRRSSAATFSSDWIPPSMKPTPTTIGPSSRAPRPSGSRSRPSWPRTGASMNAKKTFTTTS